ncbi:ABC transporter substrate-binding protein [Devosia yakushimensis]|uniref:ABC transporter substrate-binding protein n=1 Tax=Devosia yakushimensis TaxID=470028 RepID=A0ABQ5UJF4_9HYPH|nr:ABC transporter substrate-binding protein [Devosia yakushimensis]GLQ11743.1 ABC transporter substrate-binding protein [Devosia yakushimensis]
MRNRFATLLLILAALCSPTLAQPFPVTVEHALGQTTIPALPQRVVSIGLNDQDFLYALGIAPIGVHEWWGEKPYATWPWAEAARAATGATPTVMMGPETNLEWVAAQNPDLIVATYYDLDRATYDLLSHIAPVVAHPMGFPAFSAPWQTQLDLLDRATSGSTEKSTAIIAGLDAQTQAIRNAHPEFVGKTASMADFRDGQFTLWSSQSAPTRFLTSLGFAFPAELDAMADAAGWIYLSVELADRLDLDLVVWPNGKRAEIEAVPTYQTLRLFREERSLWPEPGDDTLSASLWFQTPLSLAYAIDKFAPKLAAALDGRPGD